MPTFRKQTQSYKTIIAEIEKLPDGKVKFNERDDEIIRKYYPLKGTSIAKVMGRSKSSVSNRADRLGIKYGCQ